MAKFDKLMASASKSTAARRETTRTDIEDLGGGKRMSYSVKSIPLSLIDQSPYQPRLTVDQAFIEELADCIQSVGLSTPILVRPIGDRYELIDGHRRLAACTRLEWEEIPCNSRELTDKEARILVFVSNKKRGDYTDYETGKFIKIMLDRGDYRSKAELERDTGIERSAIYRALCLAELPKSLTDFLDEHPDVVAGNSGPALKKACDEGNVDIALEALQHIRDDVLKESYLGTWLAKEAAKGSREKISAANAQTIKLSRGGKFKGRIKLDANGAISLRLVPLSNESIEPLFKRIQAAIGEE